MYTILMFGMAQAVLIRAILLFQGVPNKGVSLYTVVALLYAAEEKS